MSESIQIRKPDIAFWFDEKEKDTFMVKVREDITYTELAMALADLISRVANADQDTILGSFKKEGK